MTHDKVHTEQRLCDEIGLSISHANKSQHLNYLEEQT